MTPAGHAANGSILVDLLLTARAPSERHALLRPWLDALGDAELVRLLKEQADAHWGRDATVSLRLADAIIDVADLTATPAHRALGVMARGDALRLLGRYEESVIAFDAAGILFREGGDDVGWARTRIGRIVSCLYLGRLDEADACAAEARAVLVRHGAWLYAARVDLNAAVVAREQGDDARAAALYDRAVATYRRLAQPPEWEIARVENNRALLLISLGRLDEATALLIDARLVFARREDQVLVAIVDAALAYIHMLRGEYTRALRLYRDSVAVLRRHDEAVEAAVAEHDMIMCLLYLNRSREALEQANTTMESLSASPGERARTQALRALAQARLGDFDAALADLESAEAVLIDRGLQGSLGAIALQRAEIHWLRGRARECARAARQAARFFRERDQRLHGWQATLLAARALLQLGRRLAPGRLARRFLDESGLAGLPGLAQTAHYLLGQLAEGRGDLADAARQYLTALDALDTVGGQLLMDLRGHFLADKLDVYRAAVSVCLTRGDVIMAFQCAERARSRGLVEHVARAIDVRLRARSEADRPLVEELTTLRRERAYYATVVEAHALGQTDRASSHPTSIGPAEAEQALAERERRIAVLWEHYQTRLPAYGAPDLRRVVPDLPTIPRAAAMALIAFFEDREGLLAFVVDDRGTTAHRLGTPARTLDRTVALLRLNMARAAERSHEEATWRRLDVNARALLGSLHQALLAPLAERLVGHDRLVIVPHASLHHVPFAALHDGQRYLCERVALSVLPACALLRAETSPTSSPTALVMAHSQGDLLPAVRAEAETIAALFPTRLATEADATRAVLEAEGQRHAIVHLATHAGFRADAPLFSAVFLADGPFDTVDVANLTLSCSLVTLSGCETGNQQVLPGDELLGLSRAFLYAGARSLLLTLWRVEDTATEALIRDVYSALRIGANKDEALRQAQATAARRGVHPFWWAGFTLIGEAGPL